MAFKGEKGYSPLHDETVFYSNLIPFSLPLGVQAKFPVEGLIKTASSGAIQGKAILMKAENAELAGSKLERINSNKFIAGMAKRIPAPVGKSMSPTMGNTFLKSGTFFLGRQALPHNMNCNAVPPPPSCGKYRPTAEASMTEAFTIRGA